MKTILVTLVSLATASAFAAGKSSNEYYFQPAGGASSAQVEYSMDSKPGKTETTTTESDYKTSTSDFLLKYQYGLNESNAVGVSTFFGSNKTTTGAKEVTASGMGDLHAFWAAFSGMWHYGADLGLGLEKIKVEPATSANSGLQNNRSSGGSSLMVHGGLLMGDSGLNYGADLSYTILGERTDDATTSTKYTGGNIMRLAGFTEYNFGPGFVGGELSYSSFGDTTSKTGSAAEVKYKGENVMGVKVYGSYDFTDMVSGIASVGYFMHPKHAQTDGVGSADVKAFAETLITLGARFNF